MGKVREGGEGGRGGRREEKDYEYLRVDNIEIGDSNVQEIYFMTSGKKNEKAR
jgi:hypothetical protein